MKDILEGDLASQSTMFRFENSVDKHSVFALCYAWVDRYVDSLKGRSRVIIDINATDDPTYGNQRLFMFNGYYSCFMYNELFFHDGDTVQIIAPILRPGNSHFNKWYVAILKRILKKIRAACPDIKIVVRADSGFSCPAFYQLADDFNLQFAIGLATNETLKRKTARAEKAVRHLFVSNNIKHQHFMGFAYQAGTWHKLQQCYSKIESKGKGINVRHIISNMEEADAVRYILGFT